MSWLSDLINVGGTLLSGYAQFEAADRAAEAGADASEAAIDYARETRDLIRQDNMPYQQSGYNALNALNVLTGLPQVNTAISSSGSGSSLNPLYGDGNTPLTAEGINQTYRDIFGRSGDQEGINHYLTRGPREGSGGGGGALTGALTGASAGSAFGPVGAAVGGVVGALGFGGDDAPPRRAYTYNELMDIHRGSDEYQQLKAENRLPPWEANGEYSANYNNNAQWSLDRVAEMENVQTDQAPGSQYLGTGTALTAADYVKQDPSYQFRLTEGLDSVAAGASARGGVLSGGAIKDTLRYAQDYASTEYSNIYNRLSNIAGLGQAATSNNNSAAISTAGITSGALQNQGYYNASGYVAQGNAVGGAIQSIGKYGTDRGWWT